MTKDTAVYYLEIHPGDVYDEAAVRLGFKRFWDAGLLDDLRIDSEETPGGVALIVHVVEKPKVTTVEYKGNRKVSNSQIKDKLKESKIEVKDGSYFAYGDVNRVKSAIADLYESLGYKTAVVTWRFDKPGKLETKLIVDIDEGDKTKIESISFTGNSVVPWWWLRWNMSKLTETAWYKFWTSADVYSRPAFDEDAAAIKSIYQEYGYKDVVIGEPVVEFQSFETTSWWSKEKKTERKVDVTIPIKEGEQFYFGKIKVEGATIFSEAELLDLFFCPEGAVLKRSRFEEGLAALEKRYREHGYIYVYANPDYAEKEEHLVDITVKLTEGPQFRLGRMEFTGNTTTRDKVLRREVKLAEGDIMDMEAFRTSMFKIQQLGFFKLSDEPDFRPNQETKEVDVTMKGEDVGRNDVQLAGGYSELDGFFGQFQFNTRNFLGNGETFGMAYTNGRRRTDFSLSYTNPWFLDKRNVLGVSVFSRTTNYADLDQRSKGASLLYGIGIRDFEGISAFYNYERIRATYTSLNPGTGTGVGGTGGDDGSSASFAGADGEPIDDGPSNEQVVGTTSAVTPSYHYDSRNDPFDPSLGTRFSFQTELAGGALGGTNNYLKPEVHFTRYQPVIRNVTIAMNAEGGWIIPYGGKDIPLFERYRLGGERTIRGFSFGSILPRNSKGHYYLTPRGSAKGGDKYLLFNLETILSVAGPFKFVLFADAGNTWIEGQGASFAKLRTSAGAEIRIFVPIFQAPLRFIYGINLQPITGEKHSDFQFTIGTNF